jgi:hypothetical protein
MVAKTCTFTNACPVVTPSSLEVAVTTTPHGLTGSVDGAVYRPALVMVPKPDPVAVQTVVASASAAKDHVTAVLLVPVTVATYCTWLGAVDVLTETDVCETGEEATETRICCCWPPPPLPGACAMQPAKGRITDTAMKHDTVENTDLRNEPSEIINNIENVEGRRMEVYPVSLILSRLM